MIDIRIPIGLMFMLIGMLIGAYGLMTDPAIYKASLNFNVNLVWGLVMLVAGGSLLLTERLSAKSGQPEAPKDAE